MSEEILLSISCADNETSPKLRSLYTPVKHFQLHNLVYFSFKLTPLRIVCLHNAQTQTQTHIRQCSLPATILFTMFYTWLLSHFPLSFSCLAVTVIHIRVFFPCTFLLFLPHTPLPIIHMVSHIYLPAFRNNTSIDSSSYLHVVRSTYGSLLYIIRHPSGLVLN